MERKIRIFVRGSVYSIYILILKQWNVKLGIPLFKKYLLFKAVYDIIVCRVFKLIVKRRERFEVRIFMPERL